MTKILIVDNGNELFGLLANIIERKFPNSVDVTVVISYLEAMECLDKDQPDVVFFKWDYGNVVDLIKYANQMNITVFVNTGGLVVDVLNQAAKANLVIQKVLDFPSDLAEIPRIIKGEMQKVVG